MTNRDRSPGSVKAHLDEIRELENKLVGLKRRFLEDASAELEQFIGENGAIPFLMVSVTRQNFAIPVSIVEEVIEMVATTPLLERRAGLIGVFNYHGKLVPLFDLSEMVNSVKNIISSDNVVVICNMSSRFIGLMVSEATDVYMVEKNDVEITEEVLPGAVREVGVIKQPDGTAGILDLWPTVMGIEPEALQPEGGTRGELTTFSSQDDA